MKFKAFGRTGLRVSVIGFGGSRIGGVFADKASNKQALDVLRMALDSGINFYDTADMYSQGESESLIGTAFLGSREKVILATKGGYCLPARRSFIKRIKPLVRPLVRALKLKRGRLPAGISGVLSQDFSPSYLRNALHESLKRLRTDYVDLYQLHSPRPPFIQSEAFGEALNTLEELKAQGKIRFYGVATEVPEDAALCLSAPGIAAMQLTFGLLDPEAFDQTTLATAEARGLAIIARGCFGGGLLKEELDPAQLQAATPKWQRIVALRALARASGRSVNDLAFQFSGAGPGVSVTLIGMRTEDHLRDNLRCLLAPPLTADEYDALRRIHNPNGNLPVSIAPEIGPAGSVSE